MEKHKVHVEKHLFIKIWMLFCVFALIGGVMEGASSERIFKVLPFCVVVGVVGGVIEAVFFGKKDSD
jgi:hypothetical protein